MRADEGAVNAQVDMLRCPVCFVREIDVLLLHDGRSYYCVKCSYRGSLTEVRAAHQAARSKFRNRATRLDLASIEQL